VRTHEGAEISWIGTMRLFLGRVIMEPHSMRATTAMRISHKATLIEQANYLAVSTTADLAALVLLNHGEIGLWAVESRSPVWSLI
jgi:hypothetical protein